jgi:hypothetical protein
MGVLGGYGQDPGDELGVLKVTQGGMVEQGMDSRQACIAGSGAVASLLFEHGEKAGDVLGTQVGDVESARRDTGLVEDVAEE